MFVVDASVVIKWFVPEVHGDAAGRWLASSHEYVAPDLLFSEAGNAIWKKVRRGELTAVEGQRLAVDLSRVAVERITMRDLMPDAHALALSSGLTVYDAMYVTLAVRLKTQVITADDRLTRTLAVHPMMAVHVRRVEDFSE
ncbi:MAG TPA: type II toxin-antitoxin system VapC family toxin [Candidatus Limnocylindrales bacterium]|nr:type II toxin-antitoxin system VapC family toxin [Candidatus Limnocylindrales bacterium]